MWPPKLILLSLRIVVTSFNNNCCNLMSTSYFGGMTRTYKQEVVSSEDDGCDRRGWTVLRGICCCMGLGGFRIFNNRWPAWLNTLSVG
jgi:hypothetical protein